MYVEDYSYILLKILHVDSYKIILLQFARPSVPPPASLSPPILAILAILTLRLRRVCQDAFSMCVQHGWVVPCLQIVVPTDLQRIPRNDKSSVFAC